MNLPNVFEHQGRTLGIKVTVWLQTFPICLEVILVQLVVVILREEELLPGAAGYSVPSLVEENVRHLDLMLHME